MYALPRTKQNRLFQFKIFLSLELVKLQKNVFELTFENANLCRLRFVVVIYKFVQSFFLKLRLPAETSKTLYNFVDCFIMKCRGKRISMICSKTYKVNCLGLKSSSLTFHKRCTKKKKNCWCYVKTNNYTLKQVLLKNKYSYIKTNFCTAAARVYSDEGKYDEAYGLLNKQMHLGENVTYLSVLMDYYKSLVYTRRQGEAIRAKHEFIEKFREALQVTSKECELLADSYREKDENLKAILMYQAAEALYTGENETDEIINCLQGCALGLKLSVTELAKQRPDLRSIVLKDVVPAMRRVYDKLSNMMDAHGEKMVLIRSLCLHHIETTELISDNNPIREKILGKRFN